MGNRGKRYDEDFKKMIVELYNTKSKPAGVIVREYGISDAVLYRQVKEYSPIVTEDGSITNNNEIQKLKKELSRTKEELEILKKAIAIFTQKQKTKQNSLKNIKKTLMYDYFVIVQVFIILYITIT